MFIYFYLVFVTIIGQILVNQKIINKKQYGICIAVNWGFIAGFANKEIGLYDAVGYEKIYNRICSTRNFTEWISLYLNSDKEQYMQSAYSIGMMITSKLCYFFIQDYQFFLFVGRIFCIIVLVWFITKYSDIPLISYLFLWSLNGFVGILYLIRPVYALAFGLLAIDSIINKKNKKFLILAFISTCFHISGVIFFIGYIVSKIEIKPQKQLICIMASGIVAIVGRPIFYLIIKTIGYFNPYYLVYTNLKGEFPISSFFILLFLLYEILRYYRYIRDVGRDNIVVVNLLYNLSIFYLFFTISQMILFEFNRVAWYLAFAPSILLSNIVSKEKVKEKEIICLVFVTVISIYFTLYVLPRYNAVPYKFFWS